MSESGVNGLHADSNSPPVRIALILANPIDCEALSQVLARQPKLVVIEATADLDFGLSRFARLQPDVLVVDPKAAHDALERAAKVVASQNSSHLFVLDDRLHEGRLAAIIKRPAASYFTRQANTVALLEAIVVAGTSGCRVFDPSVEDRIERTQNGLRLHHTTDMGSIASLSERELQVMCLLAEGHSVRDCAEKMHLSTSTVDNHKSRLMKKLQIHKATQLTHRAIREGLVFVYAAAPLAGDENG